MLPPVRTLLVADLHYDLRKLDWVLAGAVVALTPAAGPAVTAATNDRGEALFEKVPQGSYSARVATVIATLSGADFISSSGTIRRNA